MRIVSDRDVIRFVLQDAQRYAFYVGAGVSMEAEVIGADGICADIRKRLMEADSTWDAAKTDRALKWNDPKRRYPTCLKTFGGASQRVEYFRGLLAGKRPCFAHHALALLA